MPSSDELHWVKSTANELNNLLQVITESSQFLQRFTGGNPEAARYYDMMRSAVDRAAQLSRTMLERTTGESARVHPFPTPGSFGGAPAPAQPRHGTFGGSESAHMEVRVANPEGPRELILIVDDEDFVTLLAQRVLTDEGYRVVTARDGFQALDVYKKLQNQIELVILDFTMPIMDGAEVFSELRMINPQVPVVLSSGFTEQDKLKWMLAKGLRGFIPKPYTQQKLLLQVRSTLDAMKSERRKS
ncbi:MAG TPA: response regulator [Chthoniobacteraceae bacterium]|jgi:CheY-like chemotaxis protein|nr:response regulator [Chthoniobacteraceae bacterium]